MTLESRLTFPLRLDAFMEACLWDEENGYYATKNAIGGAQGRDGDFITAPEISQIFGELIGLWMVNTWQGLGAPKEVLIVEMGGGRGQLMKDALRAASVLPAFLDASRVIFLEKSPVMRRHQIAAVPAATFIDDLTALPACPAIFIGNEFFDALPIRQFSRSETGWTEAVVVQSEQGLEKQFHPFAPAPKLASWLADYADVSHNTIVEYCPAASSFAQAVGTHIRAHDGAALFIDYGEWQGVGDTFQALKSHQKTDPLRDLGAADLTAHVRFSDIVQAAGLYSEPLTTQGNFLARLGGAARCQQLCNKNPTLAPEIANAYFRITDINDMGGIFKCLGLRRDNSETLAGFA